MWDISPGLVPGFPLLRPRHCLLDSLPQGGGGVIAQQRMSLADVRDVMSHFSYAGLLVDNLGLNSERLADILRRRNEGVTLAVSEVDRMIVAAAAHEQIDAPANATDAIVHVRKVQDLILAEHRHRFAAGDLADEKRQHPFHPLDIVVVAPIDVTEAEYQVAQLVALSIGIDQRLTG